MRILIDSFRGEVPRVSPRALPDNAAQLAINSRLQSGDLETWRGFLEAKTLANNARTIYLLNGEWLSWESDVDVARGPVPGDTTFRTYLTGPDEYSEPRFTTFELATTGSEPFPVATRPLGVPAPDSAPTLVIGVDSTPTTFSIDILDEGNELDTSWETSPPGDGGGLFTRVEQIGTDGNPSPCYRLTYDEAGNDTVSGAWAYRNFGVDGASVVVARADVKFTDDTGRRIAGMMVGGSSTGAGVIAVIIENTLRIQNATQRGFLASPIVDSVAISGGTVGNVWYTMETTVTNNANGTQTVVARVFQGSSEIASVTATGLFTMGGYCGILAAAGSDAATRYRTSFDNIHVQASGSNGFVPVDIATSYVYTFVNDLGAESAPSPASITIDRPDGVVVTVATTTAVPSGISSEYGITTKRIYRAATGNTGTVFRFVAEIALSQETYDDTLTDSELGEVLESENFDLPPNDLRGIIALPNGVLAGFSKNQLCLSAQNRPDAWPIGNRLTVDTDIVAIANIDTTVIIGTESFPYSASGNDPANYSMSLPGVKQACVSKPSMKYVNEQVGVVFASPDGLMASLGPTRVRNLTEGVFTRRQWQDLGPETIIAAVHDDIYFFTFGGAGSGNGFTYMLDTKQTGFGLVRLDFFASAMHSDPLTDKLYLVDGNSSNPDDPDDFRFFDFFDGSGLLSDHTPDVVPVGNTFSWESGLSLSGSGELVVVDPGSALFNLVQPTDTSAFVGFDISASYTYSDEGGFIEFRFEGSNAGTVSFRLSGSGDANTVEIQVSALAVATGSAPSNGQDIFITVRPDLITVYVGGVSIAEYDPSGDGVTVPLWPTSVLIASAGEYLLDRYSCVAILASG